MTGAIGPAGVRSPKSKRRERRRNNAPNVKAKTEKPLPDGERSNGHEGQPEQGPKPLPAARLKRATPATRWRGVFLPKNEMCQKVPKISDFGDFSNRKKLGFKNSHFGHFSELFRRPAH
jgi:hypothetical protein